MSHGGFQLLSTLLETVPVWPADAGRPVSHPSAKHVRRSIVCHNKNTTQHSENTRNQPHFLLPVNSFTIIMKPSNVFWMMLVVSIITFPATVDAVRGMVNSKILCWVAVWQVFEQHSLTPTILLRFDGPLSLSLSCFLISPS